MVDLLEAEDREIKIKTKQLLKTKQYQNDYNVIISRLDNNLYSIKGIDADLLVSALKDNGIIDDIDILKEDLELNDDASLQLELPEPTEDDVENLNQRIVIDLLQQTWDDINNINSNILTLKANNGSEDVVSILNEITNNRNIEVGLLTKLLSSLKGNNIDELIQQGTDQAEEILAQSEHPIDENLNK